MQKKGHDPKKIRLQNKKVRCSSNEVRWGEMR